jgi:hypothetical protein
VPRPQARCVFDSSHTTIERPLGDRDIVIYHYVTISCLNIVYNYILVSFFASIFTFIKYFELDFCTLIRKTANQKTVSNI